MTTTQQERLYPFNVIKIHIQAIIFKDCFIIIMYIYLHQIAYYRPYNPLNLPWKQKTHLQISEKMEPL